MIGAGIPILVEDIALKGNLRVKIKIGEQFPHIDIVSLMFVQPPTIDYVLKPLGGETFGFDIAHIPLCLVGVTEILDWLTTLCIQEMLDVYRT